MENVNTQIYVFCDVELMNAYYFQFELSTNIFKIRFLLPILSLISINLVKSNETSWKWEFLLAAFSGVLT